MEKKFIIEFLPYELALKMKQLGFNEPCFGLWNLNNGKYEVDIIGVCKYSKEFKYREVLAPLYQQAFRWFRDKHNLYPSINIYNDKWLCVIKSTVSSETEISGYIVATINNGHPTFETYEEAELKCLEKLIEIVESKTEK
jgi:hypothetical protein